MTLLVGSAKARQDSGGAVTAAEGRDGVLAMPTLLCHKSRGRSRGLAAISTTRCPPTSLSPPTKP
jgi:hypothetical protein